MILINLLKTLGDHLQGTVVVAVIIFLAREFFEIRRKRNERLRKIKAIKLLIAEELERNHWAFVSMFRVLKEIKDSIINYPQAKMWLITARNGSDHFRIKHNPEKECEFDSGQGIPLFHAEMYQKLLPMLAELDECLFELIRTTYNEIFELVHYRETLTDYLSGEDLSPYSEMTKNFLARFVDEEKEYFDILNNGYKSITGNELKNLRLR